MQAQKTYLALGDSYTIGESVKESDRYPNQLAELLKAEGISMTAPEIVATTGWRTDDLLKAIAARPAGLGYDLVTLLIGVNNQYQHRPVDQYKKEFTELLEQAIGFAKGKPEAVYVISIPDYGVTPFARGVDTKRIGDEIDEYNEINRSIAKHYKVRYLSITVETRKALHDDLLMASDGLHYSGKEMHIWASMLAQEITRQGLLK